MNLKVSRKSTIQLVESTTQRMILSVSQIDFPLSRTDYTTEDNMNLPRS